MDASIALTHQHHYSLPWTKPQKAGVAILTFAGSFALASAIVLVLLKHYGISLGQFRIHALSYKEVLFASGGFLLAGALFFLDSGILIHKAKKTTETCKKNNQRLFQQQVKDFTKKDNSEHKINDNVCKGIFDEISKFYALVVKKGENCFQTHYFAELNIMNQFIKANGLNEI